MGKVITWIENNPALAVLIGGAGVIFLLWLFGAFSSKSQGDGGAANMAAAYYAAEAQQAVVGGQIQQANIAATRDTAIAGLQADALTKVTSIQATRDTTINQQNAGATMALSADQLLATYSNNATNLAVVNSNNATAQTIAEAGFKANLISDWFHTILPMEFAAYPSAGIVSSIPGTGETFRSSIAADPNILRASGYSEDQIGHILGLA